MKVTIKVDVTKDKWQKYQAMRKAAGWKDDGEYLSARIQDGLEELVDGTNRDVLRYFQTAKQKSKHLSG
jgi:hypothetical protein